MTAERTEANPRIRALVRAFNFLLRIFGRTPDGERRVWLHWQNLREDPKGRPRGFPWHGRAWLRFWSCSFNWEWTLGSKRCGVGFELGGEDGLSWNFAVPPVSFFFSLGGVVPRRWTYGESIDTSLRIFDWAIWWNVWRNDNHWSRSVPRWRNGNFHPLDLLLGKVKFSTVVLDMHDVLIPLPEGTYPAKVKISESTWKRPRWFAKRHVGADISPVKPIPFPGKGENSYDCGEDALHGLSCSAKTVEAAVAATVESVLRSRRRHGGNAMMRYPAPVVP